MKYFICKRCVMDTSDPDICFDLNGVCSHCKRYEDDLSIRVYGGEIAQEKLARLVAKIKHSNKNKEYDCIIGVSGGVDSTYVAYLVKRLGLRPLAVHFDNGWNSQLAVSNIEKTLKKLEIDLYTYVIDWVEFRELQIAFLKASVPDGEVPTDHAINALLFNEAAKRNIKFIINGMNFATESLAVPSWSYGHSDWKYIRNVNKIFGKTKLKGYPHFSLFKLFYFTFIKRIKVVSILNYIEYNKDEVMNFLRNELEWVYYGGKHYESVYTKFYQAYILPRKFNIDKRRGHFSDLIHAGQLSREEAITELQKPAADYQILEQDKEFVIKKFEMTNRDFEDIMALPLKSFRDYPNNFKLINRIKKFVNYLRDKNLYSR
jgi:N-acetyl sugar amidotransferase